MTPGAYQPRNHIDDAPPMTSGDAFVTKLVPTGDKIVYSTFLGGSLVDEAVSVAVDRSGDAYLMGWTLSSEAVQDPYPVTPNAFQPRKGRDPLQCPYYLRDYSFVLGPCEDAFVSKLDANGAGLVYSTYLGGSFVDKAVGIAVDSTGNAWVAGRTLSRDLPWIGEGANPLPGGASASFLAKLDPDGGVRFLTQPSPGLAGIALDPHGVYLTGTASTGLPVTPGAAQEAFAGGIDGFVARIDDPRFAEGDLTGDGVTNIQDAALLLQFVAGLQSPSAEQREAGDLNGDGKISVQDAALLLKKAVGL